jgi:hypothetical protein
MISPRILPLGVALFGAALCFGCSDPLPGAPTPLSSPTTNELAATPGGPEYADVSNQGGAGVHAVNGASLVRQPNGLQARLSMPTPAPGSYTYPTGITPGHPEVFTLWMFVFNYPDLCSAPCDSNDLGVDKPARGGAYNAGGHPASGNTLTIAGRIAVGETPFDHPVITMAALELPGTAEVHLAIAPHGGLDPSKLPNEFRIPKGTPAHWWVAVFD